MWIYSCVFICLLLFPLSKLELPVEENKENYFRGTSLEVHWLRLCAPSARGLGSVPGQGTKSCMLQLRFPHAIGESLCSQIKLKKKKKNLLQKGLFWFSTDEHILARFRKYRVVNTSRFEFSPFHLTYYFSENFINHKRNLPTRLLGREKDDTCKIFSTVPGT